MQGIIVSDRVLCKGTESPTGLMQGNRVSDKMSDGEHSLRGFPMGNTVSGKGLQEKRASEYYAGKHCLWQKMMGKTLIDFPVGITLYAPSLMGFRPPYRGAVMNVKGNEILQRPDTRYPMDAQITTSAGGYRAAATPYPQRFRYPENFNTYRSPGADTLEHSQRGNNLIITQISPPAISFQPP